MLNGRAGDDELFFGNGTGTLNGGTGNDRLTAGDGGVLNGGDGNDVLMVSGAAFVSSTLTGGAGADTLYGVEHLSMTFDYNAVSDSPAGAGEMSSIILMNSLIVTGLICPRLMPIPWWPATRPSSLAVRLRRDTCGIRWGSARQHRCRYGGGVRDSVDRHPAARRRWGRHRHPPVRLRDLMKGVPIRGRPSASPNVLPGKNICPLGLFSMNRIHSYTPIEDQEGCCYVQLDRQI